MSALSDTDLPSGYSCKIFVERPSDIFLCPICKEVLRKPVNCLGGHTFCTDCINYAIDLNPKCPCCRKFITIDNLGDNILIQECISKLEVKCNLAVCTEVGDLVCGWRGALEYLEAHKNNCAFGKVFESLSRAMIDKTQTDTNNFDQNNVFYGQLKNGMKDGYGCCSIDSLQLSYSYSGGWKEDKKDGCGVFRNSTYEYCGGFQNDHMMGSGRLTFIKDLSTFTGNFTEGRMIYAYAVFRDGEYWGDVNEFEQDGEGKMSYGNSATYSGSWKKGKFHGFGVFCSVSGETYEGMFEDGLKCGIGVLSSTDGSIYNGAFLVDQKHGWGELKDLTGRRYQGEFRGNEPFGEGTWFSSDGTISSTRCKRNIECVYLDN